MSEVRIHNLQLIAICEPKISSSYLNDFRLRLNMDAAVANLSGSIWVFYQHPWVCSILGESRQHLSLRVQHNFLPSSVCMSFLHASCTADDRVHLWEALLVDKPPSDPWLIGGDFNVILDSEEKRGGRPFVASEAEDLLLFMTQAEVFDAGFSGSRFTWCNNREGRARIWKKLDRVLLNHSFLQLNLNLSVQHLTRDPSDHAPLLLSAATRLDNRPRPFRFLNVWTTHHGFLQVVRDSWCGEFQGGPLPILVSKLRKVKENLRAWSLHSFGDIFQAVKQAESVAAVAEANFDNDDSDQAREALHKARAELRRCLSIEDQFWQQKAKIKWLKDGDSNSKFFHSVVAERRMKAVIHRIKTSHGHWVSDEEDIAAEAVAFFSSLFSAEGTPVLGDLSSIIPVVMSPSDNLSLEATPSLEEVRRVVFDMDRESATGPDGWEGEFFTTAWEIVGEDLHKAVVSFFCGATLPRSITATSILLIPKVQCPQDFSQFRPISLCNFVNKLISRVLADRLANFLPQLISPQQSGFVKGRLISDNFLMAQELITGMGNKKRGGNIALKLDMAKAYDRVSWFFLTKVLRAFGFSEVWIDMIWRLISNCWFSVIINGSPQGFFKSSRGLRQGDPLSPSLFILCAEYLSRSLNQLPNQRAFVGFQVPRGCPTITHLAYADDVIIFLG